jgi:hypothetical protein
MTEPHYFTVEQEYQRSAALTWRVSGGGRPVNVVLLLRWVCSIASMYFYQIFAIKFLDKNIG